MRERHTRRPLRPIAYAVMLLLAFATAAGAAVALWRAETAHTARATP